MIQTTLDVFHIVVSSLQSLRGIGYNGCCDAASKSIALTLFEDTQPAYTSSKLTIETLEQGVKYVQS